LIENDSHPPEADFATLNTGTEENVKVKMKSAKSVKSDKSVKVQETG
jgi:hypothetical protein